MNKLHPTFRQMLHDGRFYAVLSAAGFSLKAIFVKLAYGATTVDALTLLALRMGIALPFFGGLILLSKKAHTPPIERQDAFKILLLGMTGYYLSSLFDFYGLEYVSAGMERLILYVYPSLVLIFQALTQRAYPKKGTVHAMLVCYLGLGIAFFHDAGAGHANAKLWIGAAWVFASAVTYALYYLGTGAMVKRLGSMRLAGWAGAASSMLVLAHYGLTRDLHELTHIPSAVWWYAFLMALISTVLPVYWMAIAIQRMGAAQAAAIGNLGPVLTLFAAWAVLGEIISVYQVIGLILVLLGISKLKGPSSTSVVSAS